MSTPPQDDAQRTLEQRALRNVRDLVDRMENDDVADRRSQKRMVAILAVIALAVAAGIAWKVKNNAAAKPPVVIDMTKLPPVRPGPPPASETAVK